MRLLKVLSYLVVRTLILLELCVVEGRYFLNLKLYLYEAGRSWFEVVYLSILSCFSREYLQKRLIFLPQMSCFSSGESISVSIKMFYIFQNYHSCYLIKRASSRKHGIEDTVSICSPGRNSDKRSRRYASNTL